MAWTPEVACSSSSVPLRCEAFLVVFVLRVFIWDSLSYSVEYARIGHVIDMGFCDDGMSGSCGLPSRTAVACSCTLAFLAC